MLGKRPTKRHTSDSSQRPSMHVRRISDSGTNGPSLMPWLKYILLKYLSGPYVAYDLSFEN